MLRVYYGDTDALNDPHRAEEVSRMLSDSRLRKAEQLRFPKDQRLCLAAGLLLDRGLAEYGLREKTAVFALTEHGKPFLPGRPDIHFNLSHSGTKVLAVFGDTEVGCDVEAVRTADTLLAKRFFHPAEQAQLLREEDPAARDLLFFRFWTLKESFIKADGRGMSLGLSSFAFDLSGSRPRLTEAPEGKRYTFAEPELLPGYRAALCAAAEAEAFPPCEYCLVMI